MLAGGSWGVSGGGGACRCSGLVGAWVGGFGQWRRQMAEAMAASMAAPMARCQWPGEAGVLCRDRNLRGARVIRLHILARVFILIHIAAIGAEVGIIGSLNWTRGHRILRGNEGGGIRRRNSRGARRAALQWATRVGGTHRRGGVRRQGRPRSHTGCGRQELAVVLMPEIKMAGVKYV